jgi:hypothetical protein
VWELPDDLRTHAACCRTGQASSAALRLLREAELPLNPILRARLQQERTLTIRLIVPPDLPGGIAVYGMQMGCYPMDPTVILEY